MFLRLFILFALVPMIELAILIEIGSRVGTFHTIMLIITTGLVGALLAQSQGLAVIRKIQEELSFGRPPAGELFDGLFVLVGGVLLITPGILTDVIGFTLLLPVTRNLIKQWLILKIQNNISRGETNFTSINFFR
ncbi:MAG TPA: FxsA family protein [Nitrospinota bacterium]|jgi:UPF0716 protein FxsA|nr:FxsA family protein [Nitrospinota bacterium]